MNTDLTLAQTALGIRTGKLDGAELLDALIARIEQHDGQLDSILHLPADAVRAEAASMAAERRAGTLRGPLHGVPILIKDIIDVAGMPTTGQCLLFADRIATRDATSVARLRAAGALILGKAATHELAFGGGTLDAPIPPARNPWNRERVPGGSSSGSAAAVAAGFAPGALGSDTGGSIRQPAALCGITGLKPSFGLVGRRGALDLAPSMDHIGPMARTAEDCALLLQALAGPDPDDAGSVATSVPDYIAGLRPDLRGLRIGIASAWLAEDAPQPEMAQAIGNAFATLCSLGAEPVEVKLPTLKDFLACGRVLLLAEAFQVYRRLLIERPEDFGDVVRDRLRMGAFLSAADYLDATIRRRALTAAVDAAFTRADVIVSAVLPGPAGAFDDVKRFHHATLSGAIAYNVTGHPALTLPCGFSGDGLPLGWQIAGRRFEDATVLRVAHAYQQATDWTGKRPVLSY